MKFRAFMAEAACSLLRQKLAEHRGNACATARDLGLHRNTLSRLMEKYGVDPWQFRSPKKRAIATKVAQTMEQRTA